MTQSRQPTIAPEEWDFKPVKKQHLHVAVKYEYLRELVSPAQARKARKLLNEFDKIEHKELLYAYPSMDDLSLPRMLFAQKFPAFPRPWLKLTEKIRALYAEKMAEPLPPNHPAHYHVYDGFDTVEPPETIRAELISKRDPFYDKYGTFTWHVAQINWQQSDTNIAIKFKGWLKSARPKDVKPKVFRGRGEYSDPSTMLRWLSAYRLQKAGMSYKKAKKFIETHTSEVSIGGVRNRRPCFAHQSGWDGAIKKAQDSLSSFQA